MKLNYNPNTQRGTTLGFKMLLPNRQGTSISTPPALTASDILEQASEDYIQSALQTQFLNLAVGDDIELSLVYFGYNEAGGISPSLPSTSFTHTVGAAAKGLIIKPATIPVGIAGIGLIAKLPGQLEARLVDYKPAQGGKLFLFTRPNSSSLTFKEFEEKGASLIEGKETEFPLFQTGASEEIQKRINTTEIHNSSSVDNETGSSLMYKVEVVNPDIAFLQYVDGGGHVLLDSEGNQYGGSGVIGGETKPPVFVKVMESGNQPGKFKTQIVIAKLIQDTTTRNFENGRLPVEIKQQSFSCLAGVNPVPWTDFA